MYMRIPLYLQALIKIHYKGGLSMKKEVILVSKDKCPLDVLTEMGERTNESWIFLHINAVQNLQHSDGVSWKEGRKQGTLDLTWKATETNPETRIIVDISGLETAWKPIIFISASDIAFKLMSVDPEDIFFLKMAE